MPHSILDIEQEIETLRKDEVDLRKQKDYLMNIFPTEPSIQKSLDIINQLMNNVLISQNNKIKEIQVLMEREKETDGSPTKRKCSSLPPPTCGSSWTSATLQAYSISFHRVHQLDKFLFQSQCPSKSSRAIQFEDACSNISFESLSDRVFPTDCNAGWFAKHLYAVIRGGFGNLESSVDDMVIALFQSLGFNDGNLITVSRNKLEFRMSNGKATAEADITVFNLSNMLRLAVVEDKRCSISKEFTDGEAQLVAEAIAASMHNRRQIAGGALARRAISEPPVGDPAVLSKNPSYVTTVSDIPLFMIRVLGSSVSFYSHRFDEALLDCVANKEDPKTFTQIQQYVPIVNDKQFIDLSLVAANQRRLIIEILDAIQQILSV